MTLATLPSFPGLTFPITRSNKGFGVIKQDSISGARMRIPTRNIPQYVWTISFNFLRSAGVSVPTIFTDTTIFTDGTVFASAVYAEMQSLNGFYNSLYGGTLPFLYSERDDSVASRQIIGVGDGASTAFQLVRKAGGFVEPVYAPTSVQILISNVVQADDTYTISSAGLVTFNTAPASGALIAWTGSYSWICRFDDDSIDFENFMSGLWQLKKLTFSSEILA